MIKKLFCAGALVLILSNFAYAGSPLKGVDVKLGKSPGGGCSARVATVKSSADGSFEAKGLEPGTYEVCTANAAPLLFTVTADGKLSGTVSGDGKSTTLQEAARVKSHSNQTNN